MSDYFKKFETKYYKTNLFSSMISFPEAIAPPTDCKEFLSIVRNYEVTVELADHWSNCLESNGLEGINYFDHEAARYAQALGIYD